jgi:hypothetical protein
MLTDIGVAMVGFGLCDIKNSISQKKKEKGGCGVFHPDDDFN